METTPLESPVRLDRAFLTASTDVVSARRIPAIYNVRFCRQDEKVETLEGRVSAQTGDAIVADEAGNRWPVSSDKFLRKYEPLQGLAMGSDGLYRSLPVEVRAARVPFVFEVRLAGDGSILLGQPNDWMLDYGDGSLGVIAGHLFEKSYEIL